MSTIQHKHTRRAARLSIAAVFVTCVLGACAPAKEEDDGGADKQDASAQDGGRNDAGKDAGGTSDGSTDDTGAAHDASNDADVEDADVEEDASTNDSGPVIVDPIVAGDDPPEVESTDVGYFDDDLEDSVDPRILIRGRDPNGDVASYTLKFFNGTTPVSYDLDNDPETPSSSEFTNIVIPTPDEAGFFVTFEPTGEFARAVDIVKIVVTDVGGRPSTEHIVMRGPVPPATGVCDPQGFNRCTNNRVCLRQGLNNLCVPVTTARTNACNAALVLNPPAVTSVRGRVKQPSLWDTPTSCASGDPTLNADTVVKLRLTSPASKVVLSTNNENTSFDTTLYLLQACMAQPNACVDSNCACSDDVPDSGGNRAVLELSDLPTGDHLIVVDSFPSASNTGDAFELTVTVE